MPVITLKYKDKVLDKYQIGIGQNVTIGAGTTIGPPLVPCIRSS